MTTTATPRIRRRARSPPLGQVVGIARNRDERQRFANSDLSLPIAFDLELRRSIRSQRVTKTPQIATDLGQMRWLLFEQTETSISVTMLIILISWLAIIFMSAGLFAPANATVIIALMLAALSVAGAIFLILELDTPFDGVIQISKKSMYNALAHLGH